MQFSKLSEENNMLKSDVEKMKQSNKESEGKIEFLTNAVTKLLSSKATLEIGKEILKK